MVVIVRPIRFCYFLGLVLARSCKKGLLKIVYAKL
jgi:hypothetical protein